MRGIKRRSNITKWGTDVPPGPWSGASTALDFHQTLSLLSSPFLSSLLLSSSHYMAAWTVSGSHIKCQLSSISGPVCWPSATQLQLPVTGAS